MPQQQGAELLFAGDAMQHEAQIVAARQSDDSHSYAQCFSEIRSYVEHADLAVVNLECPLGGKPYTGYPCFCAPDAWATALRDAGFDLFLLANNHILDRRDRGLHRTLSTLDSLAIAHTGVWHDEAHRDSTLSVIANVNGFRIGFLNFTYGTNGITVQRDAVVNYIDRPEISRQISRLRADGAELVCVCVHWGDEYRLLPNAAQCSLADWLTAQDVDLIIGSHPHVIQPMEMRTSPTGKQVLLVYSLGNFISNMRTTDTRGGALLRVQLRRSPDGTPRVDSAAYALVFTRPDGYVLTPAATCTDSRAAAFRRNAESIFSKHNQCVPSDTLFTQICSR